jgi:hypothetical protein
MLCYKPQFISYYHIVRIPCLDEHPFGPNRVNLVVMRMTGLSTCLFESERNSISIIFSIQPNLNASRTLLGVCFVAEGPIRINTFGRSTQKQSQSYQSESFVAYFQMHRLKDEMTNRPMITCIMIVIICKGHECNFITGCVMCL